MASAAFLVATRASAYPALIVVSAALWAARVPRTRMATRIIAVGLAAILPNAWWLIRNALMFGDPFGASAHVALLADVNFTDVVRESAAWTVAATAPVPKWFLLTATDWPWVLTSRLIVRMTWVDPLAIWSWGVVVGLPAGLALAARARGIRTDQRSAFTILAAGGVTILVVLVVQMSLPARAGWFASARDVFIAAIPAVIALAALIGSRRDLRSTVANGAGLAYAAAANAAFLLAVVH